MTIHPRTAAPAARVTCTMAAVFTRALAPLLAQAAAAATLPPPLRAKVPADFVERLEQQTGAQDVIVLFDDAAMRNKGDMSDKTGQENSTLVLFTIFSARSFFNYGATNGSNGIWC